MTQHLLKVLCGNTADVDMDMASEWKDKLKDVKAGFAPKDCFNADESGFFFRQLPIVLSRKR